MIQFLLKVYMYLTKKYTCILTYVYMHVLVSIYTELQARETNPG